MLVNAALSAVLNVAVLAGIPFLIYYLYHRKRHKRGFKEIAQRAGLQLGETRYLVYSVLFTVLAVGVLLAWSPPTEPFTRERSPQRAFIGLGLSTPAIVMALLYGMIKTGFAEEFLFRGLIAGSLSRRMSHGWANLLQSVIFFAPHLFLLALMPEMWPVLPAVFLGALFTGWLRIRSGSILGPWLIHGALNVTICLYVAGKTVAD
jgi:membrane protease YdiL (CAAX protease family)